MSTKRTIIVGLAAAALSTGLLAGAAPANAGPIIHPLPPIVHPIPPVIHPLPPIMPMPPAPPPHHHHHDHWGDGLALGAGVVLGAALANASAQGSAPAYDGLHIRRCEARYSSYEPETDTYIGYDGRAHYCRL